MLDKAIAGVLEQGYRTGDIMQPNMRQVSTSEMGAAIVSELERLADRKSTRLNSSHPSRSRMPSSA